MNPEAGRLGLPDAENQDSWLLKLCNRLKMVVFDSMGLFAGILRPRDTCNDPITSIDLFGMIKLIQETYIRAMILGS